MKCVVKDGTVRRVTDREASVLVKSGATYASKSEWKRSLRPDAGK